MCGVIVCVLSDCVCGVIVSGIMLFRDRGSQRDFAELGTFQTFFAEFASFEKIVIII